MKHPLNLIVIVAIAICIALQSCSRVPDDVLDKERMAALLADIHTGEAVVEANSSKFPNDSVKRSVKQSIFARHGVTTEDVDRSFRWYGNHMDKFVEVYDRVIEIINEDMEDARQRAGVEGVDEGRNDNFLAFEGDSVDVWNEVRFRPFASNLSLDYMPFILRSDNNWERGDVYTFRYKLIGNIRPVNLSVAVFYSDGTIEYLSKPTSGDGWHDVSFALDSTRVAREIYGSFSYNPKQESAYVDSISLTRTRWQPWRKSSRMIMKSISDKVRSRRFD